MWLSLLPLFIAAASSEGCHLLCRFECDDPVCPAVCAPDCLPPVCQRCLNQSGTLQCHDTAECWTRCPVDQCEADACPACETLCPDGLCRDEPNCLVQCEAPECGWQCREPTDAECPPPRCVRQCDQPICEAPSGGTNLVPALITGIVVLFLTSG